MKPRITTLLLIISSLLMPSCFYLEHNPGDKNIENEIPKIISPDDLELLIGNWKAKSIILVGKTDITLVNGTTSTNKLEGGHKDLDLTVTFGKTPNTFTSAGGYSLEGIEHVGEYKFPKKFPVQALTSSGRWQYDEGNLILTEDANPPLEHKITRAVILEITPDMLVLRIKEASTEESDDISLHTEVTLKYEFERDI